MAHEHIHDESCDHDHDHGDHERDEVDEVSEEQAIRRRIALSQIRQYGDPVLRMRAHEVAAYDEELRRVAERMLELMHDADGIGLAATQVGILRRIFVFANDGEDVVLVNPVITKSGGEPEISDEGCLSLGPVRVPVERSTEVTIEGSDATGARVVLNLVGLPARCVQHELDHLDGKLTIDRTDDDSRREALKVLRPKLVLR
jgi:peptide deformylase